MGLRITPTNIESARFGMSRRLLLTLLTFYACAALLMFAFSVYLQEGKSLVLSGTNVLLALLAFLLQKQDRLQTAGACVSFGLLLTGFYAAWTSPGGIEDATIIILALSCVMAATLLRHRIFIVQVVTLLVGTALLGFRVRLGLFAGPELMEVPPIDVILVATALMIITFSLRRLTTDLWNTLQVAVDNEHKLLEANEALLEQTELVRQSEQRWRSLVDAAPDHVLQLDGQGVIVFCNREESACAQAKGRPLETMVIPEDRETLRGVIDATLASGMTGQAECVVQIEDKTRTMVFNLGPMKDEQGRDAAIVLISDVTERHRLREQLMRSQKLDSLGRLAGGIAHDFNNLLTVICGHAELAEMRRIEDDELADDLRVIRETGGRAADLTQQILAFGRRQSLRLVPLRLDEVLHHMERLLGPLIGTDMRLEVDADQDVPAVMADRSQLEQVVTNLVINARDAIRDHEEPNARKIRIAIRRVNVDERMLDELLGLEPGPHVELMVSDTGTGMTRDVQQRLFEPFFTTKKPGEGTGLGLATVYGIVHQSRGAIRVYSEPGLGTSFKIYWPVADREPVASTEMSADPPPAEVRGTEHVLLVEDDPAVLKLANAALRDLGYTVSTAEDGETALALMENDPGIDIVVSDVVMPGISGFELAEQLPAELPVILTSGYAEDAWSVKGHAMGRDHFLQKPYGPADLAAMIRRRLAS